MKNKKYNKNNPRSFFPNRRSKNQFTFLSERNIFPENIAKSHFPVYLIKACMSLSYGRTYLLSNAVSRVAGFWVLAAYAPSVAISHIEVH
ncbi:hypothetical protein PanWU01x14_037230 [Parasponia andersonii]|uniref:Uncharacterized protein n=1 Tax=Parasponia andersonii TaxID=3476 RepID=A0A2P5DSN2_PARAD|nr:hypothetical protein PanWU01x14_037230 [Parasponia andersonii]